MFLSAIDLHVQYVPSMFSISTTYIRSRTSDKPTQLQNSTDGSIFNLLMQELFGTDGQTYSRDQDYTFGFVSVSESGQSLSTFPLVNRYLEKNKTFLFVFWCLIHTQRDLRWVKTAVVTQTHSLKERYE